MEYRVINERGARDLIRRRWISQMYLSQLDQMYFFGLYDDNNKIIAVAAFGDTKGERMAVCLDYIYVHESYRGRGYARGVFNYAKKCFADIYIKEITSELLVDTDSAVVLSNFMTSLGFEAEYLDRVVHGFMRGHFQTESTRKLYENVQKLGISIEQIDNYSDKRLRRFMELKDKTGIYICEEDYVPTACVFGLIDGEIEAALCARKCMPNAVLTGGFYASDKIKDKDIALPFFMSVMAERTRKNNPEVEGVFVAFDKKHRERAIEKIYGESKNKYYQQVYQMKL